MSKITKKQFLASVIHEIEMLKKHATPEEIARLDFSEFDPSTYNDCIYGQLTTDCRSGRAKELMDVSCIRQMCASHQGVSDLEDRSFTDIKNLINGQYDKRTWTGEQYSPRRWEYLSALGGYINLKGAKNEQIIAYLKGEQPTLTL